MGASRIRLLAKGRRVEFFREPGISSAAYPWAGFSFEESASPGEPLPSHAWSKTTILYVTDSSLASLRWKHRGVWNTDAVRTGTVSLVRRDVEIQSAVPSRSFPMMVLQLDNAKLQHLALDQVLAIDQSLVPVQVTRDARLAALLSAMREEVRTGCLSGRIYGESLSLALLAYLAGAYATPRRDDNSPGTLSPAQRRSVVSYIRANLASNISVTELAALVLMSPSHFSRVFRESFGVSPYRYVMRERVEEAKEVLAGTKLSPSQVSTALGFSSQSHFVKVFRQFAGVTPRQFKAGY